MLTPGGSGKEDQSITRLGRAGATWPNGAYGGGSAVRSRTTLPAATSSCAVTVFLSARGTRAVHPRASWATRRPANTVNSNAFDSSGLCTTVDPICAPARTAV